MAENILEKIIKRKTINIEKLKKTLDQNNLKDLIEENTSFVDFKNKINQNTKNNKISIIAEIKKASPSAGVIIEDYNPLEIANIYHKNNVTCLSVLTEEEFFLGKLDHIRQIKQKLNCQFFVRISLLINFKSLLLKVMVQMLF